MNVYVYMCVFPPFPHSAFGGWALSPALCRSLFFQRVSPVLSRIPFKGDVYIEDAKSFDVRCVKIEIEIVTARSNFDAVNDAKTIRYPVTKYETGISKI